MKILLADDHSIVRMGIRLMMENEYEGIQIEEADYGNAVMEKVKNTKYDLIVLDFQMPDTDTFGVINYTIARDPDAKILIFSMASEKLYAPKLWSVGVKGFVSKHTENPELIKAIATIINGGSYWKEPMPSSHSERKSLHERLNPFSTLSPRELDIVNYIIAGKNTKEIGVLTHSQMSTISTHKARIFQKLGVINMVELIALANEHIANL